MLLNFFSDLNPIIQSFLAGLFTWGVTAIGALSVFFFKKLNQKVLDFVLGFASGVMIAASFWSLLNPSIELSIQLGYIEWLLPGLGFLAGGIFVILADIFLDKVMEKKKNFNQSKKRSILLGMTLAVCMMSSITASAAIDMSVFESKPDLYEVEIDD